MNRLIGTAIAGAAALLALECVMVVDPKDVAIVYRFGAVNRTANAGLSFRMPRPLEADTRIAVTEVQRVEVPRVRAITGDTNLVDLELVAQYTVGDAVQYSLGAAEPEGLIAHAVEAAATSVVAGMPVDLLLTKGRAQLQQQIRSEAQSALHALRAGIDISSIDVAYLAPPPAVVDAFNDVSSARGDRDTLQLAAQAYASEKAPAARGQAAQSIELARTHASERMARAQKEIHRFQVLQARYSAQPQATRVSLHADLLAEIGSKAKVISAKKGTQVVVP